jgi:hypothetical protein
MKATKSGNTIGRALSDFTDASTGVFDQEAGTTTSKVMMFIQTGYHFESDTTNIASSQTLQSSQGADALQPAFGPTTTFDGTVVVKGHLYASGDTAGEAKILAGDTKVHITFSEPYQVQPVVTITPRDFVDTMYRVTEVTNKGFTIQLNTVQSGTRLFGWHALGADGGHVTVSDGTIEDLNIVIEEDPGSVQVPPVQTPPPAPVVEPPTEPTPTIEEPTTTPAEEPLVETPPVEEAPVVPPAEENVTPTSTP